MELFSIRIQRTFQLVSTRQQADGKGAIPGHPLTLTPSLFGNLNLLSL